jgi:hypothetical protein
MAQHMLWVNLQNLAEHINRFNRIATIFELLGLSVHRHNIGHSYPLS